MTTFDCSACGADLPDGTDVLCATCSYAAAEVLTCAVGTCVRSAQPEHTPCCSSSLHGKALCCEHYCRSHFVEANPCSPLSHAAANAASVTTPKEA
ncbi:kinase domain protein [Microcystis phage MinS1]|nr:kinase domain protein [Microcystis phage MinS1]